MPAEPARARSCRVAGHSQKRAPAGYSSTVVERSLTPAAVDNYFAVDAARSQSLAPVGYSAADAEPAWHYLTHSRMSSAALPLADLPASIREH